MDTLSIRNGGTMKKLFPLLSYLLICNINTAFALTSEEAKTAYQGLDCEMTVFEADRPTCAKCNDLTELIVYYDPSWDAVEPAPVPEPIPAPITYLETDISLSTPNNGQMWNDASGPTASVTINNFQPGEYVFSAYGDGPDASSDSVHYGIDGTLIGSLTWLNVTKPGWTSNLQSGGTAKITIPDSGSHVINLFAREDGASVTKIRIGVSQ